jgi:tetratricopeptide (TPR) repeat protein
MLFYNIGDLASSLEWITEATLLLEKEHIANTVLAMLYNGTGAVLTKQGEYTASVAAYKKCHQTALRIGNDTVYWQASVNLALSLTRLGEYAEAIRMSEQTLALLPDRVPLHFQLPAVQSAVRAYAMLGMDASAQTVINKWSEQFARLPSIDCMQAWNLYVADGYVMLGKLEEALDAGWHATLGGNNDIHRDFCVGSYARWVARTGVSSGAAAESAHGRLDCLISKIEAYDAIDRAEILNAKCWLDSRTRTLSAVCLQEMIRKLKGLPRAVEDQLRQMGMLDFVESSYSP